MINRDRSWVDYWDAQSDTVESNWRSSMNVFIRVSRPLLHYGPRDVLLDIGCGPGHLEASLKDVVKEIHALDTSPRFLNLCRARFAGASNLFFYPLSADDYTDLSFLPPRAFSIIICNSVVQYYRNVGEIERLIEQVRRVAAPRARLLISDLLIRPASIADVWGLLGKASREHCLAGTVGLMLRSLVSEYHRLYLSRGLLVVPVETLRSMIQRLALDAFVLDEELTLNTSRRHLLVTF